MPKVTKLVLFEKPKYSFPESSRSISFNSLVRPSLTDGAAHKSTRFKRIRPTKRVFDLVVAGIGIVIIAPIIICVAVLILVLEGRPIFYISERMKAPGLPFKIIKFRTMYATLDGGDAGVTGGDKKSRITPVGRILRRFRLDETPQIINILRGDMSFVGPRPPLRQYTDAFPEIYQAVLQSRPGVTGLATLHFHRHEERLIARTKSPTETEQVYTTRCIPRKAALDLIYQRNASIWFDAKIMWQTVICLLKR